MSVQKFEYNGLNYLKADGSNTVYRASDQSLVGEYNPDTRTIHYDDGNENGEGEMDEKDANDLKSALDDDLFGVNQMLNTIEHGRRRMEGGGILCEGYSCAFNANDKKRQSPQTKYRRSRHRRRTHHRRH